tara:strand:+ start:751 stop:1038 length:288 start_codon:yes stop_codon:yes gene_type:complete
MTEENNETSPKEAYGAEGEEAMDKFKAKWKEWDENQKLDTLLNMVLGVAYRLDILATVVDGIPDVQRMKDQSKDLIKRERESAKANEEALKAKAK